jgi:predicted transcriptional regulator of viral defense system
MADKREFEKVQRFLEDILALHGLSKNLAILLYELLCYRNKNNEIILNDYLKKEISVKTDFVKGTIDNSLSKLHHVGLLTRLGRGVYVFHPIIYEAMKLINSEKVKIKITYHDHNRTIEIEAE